MDNLSIIQMIFDTVENHKKEKKEVAQLLINEIGTLGPENLKETVIRAIKVIRDQHDEILKLRIELRDCCSDCIHQ